MRRTILGVLLVLAAISVASTHLAGQAAAPAAAPAIWRDPGDMTALNLVDGAGGAADAPDPAGTYTFVKESTAGTSAKFEVEDQAGTRWRVKLGEESESETAASRLLWAAGYFVDEDYYLPTLTVTGLPTLRRGQAFVSAGGMVHGAGMERHLKHEKTLGTWDWFKNPFTGSRELNGLRVMMALVNNWDLKTVNNSIDDADTGQRYVVSDLGASFGNSGNYFMRSKSTAASYAQAPFIDRVDGDHVSLVMHTRPFLLSAVRVEYYRTNAHLADIVRHIPITDAKWLGSRLSQLSGEQIRDAFRSAGYSPQDVDVYATALTKRIAELNAL